MSARAIKHTWKGESYRQTPGFILPDAPDRAHRQCSPVDALHPSGRGATWCGDEHQGVTCIQLESFASLSYISPKHMPSTTRQSIRYAECRHYRFGISDTNQFHNAELYHRSYVALLRTRWQRRRPSRDQRLWVGVVRHRGPLRCFLSGAREGPELHRFLGSAETHTRMR